MVFAMTLAIAMSIAVVKAVVTSEPYIWGNVEIGGGGGFVPNIIFNPSSPGLAYARFAFLPSNMLQNID